MRIIFVLGLASVLLYGQDGRVSGPTAGLVFDSAARGLRPLLGIPGSSTMGDPVKPDFDVAAAYLSPRQDAALMVDGDGAMHYFRTVSGSLSERGVDGLPAKAERVAFSPSGRAAVIYAAGVLTAIGGLPDSPAVGATLNFDGPIDSLAISDDGRYLLLSANGAIRLLGGDAGNRKLMDAGAGAVVAFAPDGYSAAVADSSGAGLMLFRDATDAADPSRLADADDSIASPAGLAFSADGRKLMLASSAARSVALFDLESGQRNSLACSCAPAGLARMGSVFRLNEVGQDPLWLLDPAGSEPRIVFVPAIQSPAVQ